MSLTPEIFGEASFGLNMESLKKAIELSDNQLSQGQALRDCSDDPVLKQIGEDRIVAASLKTTMYRDKSSEILGYVRNLYDRGQNLENLNRIYNPDEITTKLIEEFPEIFMFKELLAVNGTWSKRFLSQALGEMAINELEENK
jgi:hypothetical protein